MFKEKLGCGEYECCLPWDQCHVDMRRTTVLPLSAHTSPGFETQPSCKAAVPLNNGTADAQCVCERGGGEHSTD